MLFCAHLGLYLESFSVTSTQRFLSTASHLTEITQLGLMNNSKRQLVSEMIELQIVESAIKAHSNNYIYLLY